MNPTRSTDRAAICIVAAILLSSLTSPTEAARPSSDADLLAGAAGSAGWPAETPQNRAYDLASGIRPDSPARRVILQLSERRDVEIEAARNVPSRDTVADPAPEFVEPVFDPDAPAAAGAVHRGEAEISRAVTRWARSGRKKGPIDVLDPLLSLRIEDLRRRSGSFDRAWADLENAGVPIVIGTDAQLRAHIPRGQRDGSWAGMTLNWGDGRNRVIRSAVAIRLDWLHRLHASFGNSDEIFLEALDRLLIHEVFGHLVPVVTAGTLGAACADAAAGVRHKDSCVGRREALVEADLRDSEGKLAHGL